METFIQKQCVLSPVKYNSYTDLYKRISKKYDCLVCGSDQIWNLNLFNDPSFFLRFERILPGIKYIAYAPSIAENLTEEQYSILSDNIKHFTSISVREKGDVIKLQQITGKKIKCVLDPVFLLSEYDWSDIMQPIDKIARPYILLYTVAGNKEYRAITQKLKKEFGYKTVCINTHLYNKYHANYCMTDVSPENFIWLIKNASIVCTTSFHALAFSIIFNKQFIVVPDEKRASRHISILNELDIRDHLFFDANQFDEKNIPQIDYNQVNIRLNALKATSLDYLRRALGK
jgi:hypothetical protein